MTGVTVCMYMRKDKIEKKTSKSKLQTESGGD